MHRKYIFHGFFTCSNDLKIVFFWGSKLYAHETFFFFSFTSDCPAQFVVAVVVVGAFRSSLLCHKQLGEKVACPCVARDH